MKIVAKLYWVVTVPLLMMVLVGAMLWRTNQILNLHDRQERVAGEVTRSAFELNLLTHDHLQRHNERTKEQWLRKHAQLKSLLDDTSLRAASNPILLAQARWTAAELLNLFTDLARVSSETTKKGAGLNRELEQLLVDQILTETQSLVSLATTIARASDLTRIAVRQRAHIVTIILMGVTAAGIGGLLLWISLSINRPLQRLHHGAEELAGGRLDHKIASTANDEVGEVSRAFDAMAASLRQREEELCRHRDHLEELVRERTEKLEQANAQLQRMTTALAESNQELQQFASVASHDLQEPLRMVAGYVQMLERRYKGKLDADADQFIWFAVDGAKRMHQLINDLLQYARVETRGKPPAPVDCRLVTANALQNLELAVKEANAEIVLPAAWPTVMGDNVQLTQLFQNLIANAVKFRRRDAPLRIELGVEGVGEEWVFHVRDNGIGIDPKFYDRIFLIFQRLHTRDEYPGTGIGLALCKRIVQRHGGRIWIESEPDKGATFYFTLPRK